MIRDYGRPVRPFQVSTYTEFKEAIRKLNEPRTDTLKRMKHQKGVEVRDYSIPEELFETNRTINLDAEPADDYERIRDSIVDSEVRMQRLITHLDNCKEIALDMEGTMEKGYRGSHPALIQISTDLNRDFLVDPLKFYGGIERLRDHMQNKDLPKIMFGATNDILWWQRYFKIDPFPVIDVQLVHQKVKGLQQPRSLEKFLWEYLPKSKTDKKFQNFDWAKRKLPTEAVVYAVNDARYLMQAWQNFKIELQYRGSKQRADVHVAVKDMNLELPKPFNVLKPPAADLVKLTNASMIQAYQAVWDWRDKVARKKDIYVTDLLRADILVSIARNLKDYRVTVEREMKKEVWKLVEATDRDELLASLAKIKLEMEAAPPKTVPNKIADLEQIEMDWSTDDELEIHVYEEEMAEFAMPEKAKCRNSDQAENPTSKPSKQSENRDKIEIEVRADNPKVRSVVVVPPAPMYSQSSRHNRRDERSSRGHYNDRERDRGESRQDERRERVDRKCDQSRNSDQARKKREESPKSIAEPIRIIRPTTFEQPISTVVTMRREVVETDGWIEIKPANPIIEFNKEPVMYQQQEEMMEVEIPQQQPIRAPALNRWPRPCTKCHSTQHEYFYCPLKGIPKSKYTDEQRAGIKLRIEENSEKPEYAEFYKRDKARTDVNRIKAIARNNEKNPHFQYYVNKSRVLQGRVQRW